jgi:hypothetical protein
MGSSESEIVQLYPRTYLEYVGGIDYSDDNMGGGDELPLVEIDIKMEEVLMPSVPVTSKYSRLFAFLILY